MVLASEVLAVTATSLAFNIAYGQMYISFLSGFTRTSGASSLSFVHGCPMFLTYAAVRLLAESESPQSVAPVFTAVVLILLSSFSKGKLYYKEWIMTGTTVIINTQVIAHFLVFKGLVSLTEAAQAHPLDRELQWYQVYFVFIASFRWLLIAASLAYFSLFTGAAGWILAVVRVTLLWVLAKGTGKTVAPSPWGIIDEILLNDTALLNVVLSLITFTVIMDQITVEIVQAERRKKSERMTWDELRSELAKRWLKRKSGEAGNDEATQEPGRSQASEMSAALEED